MASDIQRLGSKIISVSGDADTDCSLCWVRLRFRISVLAPLQSKMLVLTSIEGSDEPKSKRARRKIIDKSWQMLEAYFDGDSIENDAINICSEDQIQNHDEAPEISRVLDYDLKQELYLIDLEFAAMGK